MIPITPSLCNNMMSRASLDTEDAHYHYNQEHYFRAYLNGLYVYALKRTGFFLVYICEPTLVNC
jgi:hypothetical protein